MKQGLKANYTDKEILDLLLVNLTFTDKLIEEHLKSQSKAEAKLVPRDPSAFRDFVHDSYFSKDQEDPYTHFFIKESGKQERVKKIYNEMNMKYWRKIKEAKSEDGQRRLDGIMRSFQEKIDDMLLQNKLENEDTLSLSHQLESEVKIKYNLKSLMKSEFVNDIDPDVINADLTDAEYLHLARRRAETKFIKSKIIYKLDQGHTLTKNEQ